MKKKLRFERLTIGKGNAKVGKKVRLFDLPAGWTCPGASLCLAKADRVTGKITDGPQASIRCFAASLEAARPNVRRSNWRNLDLLKAAGGVAGMASLIEASLPRKVETVRIHASGDFYSGDYLDAWISVAERRSDVTFYFYSKSPFFEGRMHRIPENMRPTASIGGKYDERLKALGMKTAEIVLSEAEAKAKGLEIDRDDTKARDGKKNFALLIHGVQPKGSKAAAAVRALKGRGSYGKGRH